MYWPCLSRCRTAETEGAQLKQQCDIFGSFCWVASTCEPCWTAKFHYLKILNFKKHACSYLSLYTYLANEIDVWSIYLFWTKEHLPAPLKLTNTFLIYLIYTKQKCKNHTSAAGGCVLDDLALATGPSREKVSRGQTFKLLTIQQQMQINECCRGRQTMDTTIQMSDVSQLTVAPPWET